MKKALRGDANTALAVVRRSQKIRPAADPLPDGEGRPKFNQLQMVTIYLYLQTQFGEDRCAQFSSYRGKTLTNTATNPQTDRTDYNTLRRS